ncbi:EI24 domain-containing protein [Loktanella sp. F6476L]|uniref:EI24 domain-containing protein n=1 Tax=Loktanella sp. F6476L TaxID=2926405 RepID=UPI001FF3FF92|nr:EI24 domain-containing protein [Loktanella sp. F6476L]MCK0119155.1 EI24 domain-containing protein [Loktanella sp. F6476L]
MIFDDFFKAIGQMPDPRFRRVLWLGIMLTIALLVGAYALILWFISATTSEGIEIPGVDGPVTWIGDLLGWGSLAIMLVLSVLLMVPVASAITSLFLDDVAQAVEDKHYPHLKPVPRVPFFDGLRDTVNFLGVLIGANILAIFAYMALPFLSFAIFYGLNGYLLGREYFQVVAMRRLGHQGAKDLRKQHKGQIWMAGCLMAVPLSIPLINLVIPILGAATFTHLFHRLSQR